MTITENIRAKMYEAMKAKDKEKKDAYAYLLGELEKTRKGKQNANNPNPVLTEADELGVIANITKQCKAAITEAGKKPANTPEKKAAYDEFVAARNVEIELYSAFLPKQMTEDEIKEAIQKAVGMVPEGAAINKGAIMRNLMPMTRGKADGQIVAKLVDEYLANN